MQIINVERPRFVETRENSWIMSFGWDLWRSKNSLESQNSEGFAWRQRRLSSIVRVNYRNWKRPAPASLDSTRSPGADCLRDVPRLFVEARAVARPCLPWNAWFAAPHSSASPAF